MRNGVRLQTAFLLALLVYDLLMLWHVHVTQTNLPVVMSAYDPVHPLLPLPGDRPVLGMSHLWWVGMLHGMGSAYPLLAGLVQVWRPARARSLWLHRLNGRLMLLCTVAFAAIPGFWMAWGILHASLPLRIMIAGLGIIVVVACAMTWRTATRRALGAHRRWGIRLVTYLHVIPVVARLYYWAAWVTVTGAPGQEGQTFELIGWLTVVTVLPLGELFARVGERRAQSPLPA